jgi:hypothetical protein
VVGVVGVVRGRRRGKRGAEEDRSQNTEAGSLVTEMGEGVRPGWGSGGWAGAFAEGGRAGKKKGRLDRN